MKQKSFIDKQLLAFKKVPDQIITAEKVAETLTGNKPKLKNKKSYKLRLAIKNYQKAVTRKKMADTLLEKHYKALTKLKTKYHV